MKTIRQTATIRGATPHDIYESIMDSKLHSKLSRQRTRVSRRVGGAFTVGHDIEGKNLKLTKDRRIVQSWRANNWPKGTYSKASFGLSKAAGGTKITFTQTGVPSEFYKETSTGWTAYYWKPLKKTFAKAR